MPGLFDSVTPFLSGLQGGVLGSIGKGLANQQNAGMIDSQLGPGMGQMLLSNPGAAQALYGRQIMSETYNRLLQGGMDPQRAAIMAMHPEALSEQGKPITVPPGGAVTTPLFGMMGNAPNSSQQQPPSSQPSGGDAPPGAQFQNQSGIMQQPALLNLIRQALRGKDVQGQLGSGMSGTGGLNRAGFQNLMNQVMPNPRAFGIDSDPVTPEELVSRQAKFPAYEKAQETLGHVSAQMQLAQTEALGILPYLKAAAAKLNPSDFPIWNAAKQEFASQTGNPATAELSSYMNAMINTYSRGISSRGQGPTVSDKNHLAEVLSKYWSAGQWEAGTKAVINELGVANDAIHKNQNRIDVQYGFGKKADPADEAAAQAAIARGADKQEVIRRFEEGGFNAPKF